MSQLGLGMSEETRSTPPRRRIRGGVAVLLALALVAGLLVVGYAGLSRVLDAVGVGTSTADYPGPGEGEVVVEVERGENATDVARRLDDLDVVASAQSFVEAAQTDGRGAQLRPGYYRLLRQMSAEGALTRLLDPAARAEKRVTVPEGLRLDETLDVLARGTGLPVEDLRRAATFRGIGLPDYADGEAEGYLYPSTYDLPPDVTAPDALRAMTERFAEVAQEVGLERDGTLPAHDLVTVASLVEEEAGEADDFGKVARVVYNRLARKMPLQFDSTVNYVLEADKDVIRQDDIDAADSPYNTYREPGLPPGPISSPGEAALRAAVDPPAGDWLYFVTTDLETGETKFTADYDQFVEFKAELQRNNAAQGRT